MMVSRSTASTDIKPPSIWNRIPVRVLLAFLTVVIILVVVGSYLFFQNQEKKIVQDNYSSLLYIAQFKVQQITQWRQEKLLDVTFFSSSPLFQESLTTWSKNKRGDPLPQALLDRMELIRSLYGYEAAWIVAKDGKQIYPESSQLPDPGCRNPEPGRSHRIDENGHDG